MHCRLLRTLAMICLLGAAARATPRDTVAWAADDYLNDASRMPLGVTAATAGGGVKGWLNVRAILWYPSLSGTGNDEGGGDYDVESDLGIDGNELSLVPQITIDFWIFGFRTDYFDVGYKGEGTIESTFTFGGLTFTAGENVSSDVRIQAYRSLGMISFLDTDVIRIAGIIGFNYYTYDATITGQAGGGASISGSLPFPVVGVLVQGRISDLLLELEASGFSIRYGDVDATAIDWTVSAAWNFLKFGEVRIGYRFVSIDGTIDDSRIDVRLDGFFVALGVTF